VLVTPGAPGDAVEERNAQGQTRRFDRGDDRVELGDYSQALLIAEKADLRARLSGLLTGAGCQVTVARTAHQAMVLARGQLADIVVLCLPLRTLPAETIVTALRVEWGLSPRLVLVAPQGRMERGPALMASSVVEMPFEPDEFTAAVRRSLVSLAPRRYVLTADTRRQGSARAARRNRLAGTL
jgi:DNA-binding response OmpR family regulator